MAVLLAATQPKDEPVSKGQYAMHRPWVMQQPFGSDTLRCVSHGGCAWATCFGGLEDHIDAAPAEQAVGNVRIATCQQPKMVPIF